MTVQEAPTLLQEHFYLSQRSMLMHKIKKSLQVTLPDN
jgi:hypothetical protein